MEKIIKVPIRPHLKKFVCYKENIELSAPLEISDKSYITYFINIILTTKGRYNGHRKKAKIPDTYTESLLLRLQKFHYNQQVMFLTPSAIIRINGFLHRCFHDSLNQHIEGAYYERESSIKEAIYGWMSLLEIYDDITFDALKKGNYRFRKAKLLPHL